MKTCSSLIFILSVACHGSKDELDGSSDDGLPAQTADIDMVDSECLDGQYAEVPPDPSVGISSALDEYRSSDVLGFIDDVLGARYPIGQFLFMGGYENQGNFSDNCLNYFLNDSSSGEAIIGQMSTLVHECGHFFDIATGGWSANGYHITDEISFTCNDGNTPDNGGGRTFSRSLIKGDEYASLHTPCENWTDQGCDSYAAIYLNGDPNDSTFESGDQGYGMLHEETVQYINSLATSYAFNDQHSGATSARDGILTFLWYTMRYLRMARLEHPDAYELLSQDDCWREVILTTWGRAWLYLYITQDMASLGIDDDFLYALVDDNELLEEIQRLREIQGCQ